MAGRMVGYWTGEEALEEVLGEVLEALSRSSVDWE